MKTVTNKDTCEQAPRAIMVLGGGVSPQGTCSPEAAARTRCAVELWRSMSLETLLIFSGGVFGPGVHRQGESPLSEAGSMAVIAQDMGVPEDIIILEEISLDTLGNFYFTARDILLPRGIKNLWVVTSSYHCRRSALIADKLLKPLGISTRMHPSPWPRSLRGRWLEVRRRSGIRALFTIYDSNRPQVRYIIMEKLHPYYGSLPTRAWLRSLFRLMLT